MWFSTSTGCNSWLTKRVWSFLKERPWIGSKNWSATVSNGSTPTPKTVAVAVAPPIHKLAFLGFALGRSGRRRGIFMLEAASHVQASHRRCRYGRPRAIDRARRAHGRDQSERTGDIQYRKVSRAGQRYYPWSRSPLDGCGGAVFDSRSRRGD